MFHAWLIVALINKKKCQTNADRINSRQRAVLEEKSGGSYNYMQIKLHVFWVGFFFVFEWSDPFMSNSVQQSQIKLMVLGHCRQAVQLEQKKKKPNPYSRYGLFQPLNPNPPQGKRSLCKLLTFVAVHWLLKTRKKETTNSFIVGIFVGPDNSCLLPWQWIPQHSPCNVTNPPTTPRCKIPLLTVTQSCTYAVCLLRPLYAAMTALSQRWIHRQRCSQNK